jgi:hypothetical protein
VSGTLTIKAGFISGTISIPIASDGIAEGDEYFDVTLSKPVNVTIADGTGRVTIKDGVPPATFTLKAASREMKELQGDALSVQVLPNPFNAYATLNIKGSVTQSLTIRVVDAAGRIIETRRGVIANSTIRLGNNYRAGIYYVEIVQGDQKRVVPLVKSAQ